MRTKLFAAVLVTALCLPATAVADHRPWPHASLVTMDASEPGSFGGARWATRSSWECVIAFAEGEYGFPSPPVQWVPGTEVAVRIESAERPRRVEASAFLFGDPTTGTPIYGQLEVPNELRRVEVEGETMWEAVLSPPPWPDLYLEVKAEWKRISRCGERWATWKWRAGLLPI